MISSKNANIKGVFSVLVATLFGVIFYGSSQVGVLTSNLGGSKLMVDSKNSLFYNYKNKSVSYNSLSENILGETTESALSVPVLIYHGIVENVVGEGDVLYEDFKSQMISLKENGYETITLTELYNFLNNGANIPKKSFVLTFDDGRKDSYFPVDPILKALDYEAVMFIISGSVKDNDVYHLTRNEIISMLATNRWEIGSHSSDGHVDIKIDEQGNTGHWLSNKMWLSDLKRVESDEEYSDRISTDLTESKITLEKEFSKPITGFAFPFGDYGQNTKNYPDSESIYLGSAKSNYKMAFYQSWSELGNRNYPGQDTFLIRRITVDSGFKEGDLLSELENGQDKYVGYTDSFQNDSSWIGNWGSIQSTNEQMKLLSDEGESGASAYLRGTETWKDYSISADVKIGENVDTFSILANLDRKNNYSYCNFSKNGVSFNEKSDGVVRAGKYWNHSLFYTFPNGFNAGMINNGKTISCLVNGKVVVKDDIRNNVGEGMIGFSIWSEIKEAEVIVDNFESSGLE